MKERIKTVKAQLERFGLLHRNAVLKAVLTGSGVYAGQPPILRYIREHPGCTQAEIAETLEVTPASIAASTKRMQNSGLIFKQVDSGNMRANKLFLTPKGAELEAALRENFEAINEEMFRGFTDDELDQFASYILRLNENLEEKLSQKGEIQ